MLGYPPDGFEYRGKLRLLDEAETLVLEQTLQTRRKPEWLVNVRHQGQGALTFSLQARRCNTRHWKAVSQLTLNPAQQLNGQSSTVTELPLPGWDEAPQLQLQIRLSKSQTDETPTTSASMANLSKAARPAARDKAPASDEPTVTPEELAALPPLTKPEQVIVKDSWNKLLAFQDLLIQMFVERLLHEEPDLPDRFGDSIDLVPTYFAALFDVTVRQINPRTERVLRESYGGIYPAPPEGYKTTKEYAALLADLGMRPKHWLTARRVWAWMLPHIPYLEEYDRENLAKGVHSALYRFFSRHILPPALLAIREYDEALSPDMIRQMRRTGESLVANARATGIDFYRLLFQTYPEVLPYFGRTDVDSLAGHLMQSIAFLVRSLEAGRDTMQELRELARLHASLNVPADAYPKIAGPMLEIMKQRVPGFSPEEEHAWKILLTRIVNVLKQPVINEEKIRSQAEEFIDQLADELAWEPADHERRWAEIEREIHATGTYTHTYEELAYGAQLAWRNSAKCVGRIAWKNMIVRDLRHVNDPDQMFAECVEHLRMGTNGGNMQIVMNVFRAKKPMERWGPRIWNPQYVRYAAYEQEDGTILGDKANLGITQAVMRQGWTPPAKKTAFDVLPIVIEVPGQAPKMYTFPEEEIVNVPIQHPDYPGIDALGLQWCAIPAIANFGMEIGGVYYGCLPFNGWFMETEIARNLFEDGRYDKAEAIAQAMGLDTSSEQTLWRDQAFLELNKAVLHSFSKHKVTLVDHQTAARQFLTHDLREKRAGRECPAQWSWVVPSAGGSTTPVWHHEMRDFHLSPQYLYAADKWAVIESELTIAGEGEDADESGAAGIMILYGSETGTAEGFARQTARRLNRFRPRVLALDEFNPAELPQMQFVLVVTSTFGDGELPGNARKFHAWIREQPRGAFEGLNFSVMAIGSTVYPNFCAAGATLERELMRIGGNRVVPMHKGDEIRGQADTFRQWLDLVARLLGEDPTSTKEADEVRLQVQFMTADAVPAGAQESRQQLQGVAVPVVANRELLKEVVLGSRSTRFIAFDISGSDLTYETGDHVAVYPSNPPKLVQRVCDRLSIDPDTWFRTSLVDRAGAAVEGDHAYPQPVTVRQALTQDVDLSLREPFNELIDSLYKTAESSADKTRLETWRETLAHDEQAGESQALKKHIADNFVSVADLLEAFPSAKLDFAQLIDLLPKQKPRLYSISSCSLLNPGQIHVTFGVIQITTDAGQTRPGLCSNYLASLDPERGATARIAVRTSKFRPPQDPRAPMLMVGPGTGLSPLIGFLQHREVQLRQLHAAQAGQANGADTANQPPVQLGHARLYFGCRNLNDYLYQEELEGWRNAGVLSHLDVAFSRLDDEKVYVQHLIGQHGKDLWDVLSQPDCHYYVCGDARMADDVFAVLMTIAKTEGGLTHAEAVDFFGAMQAQNRFVMDVWGILLNFPKALADVQDARYSQGERWLERVSTREAAVEPV